MSQKTDVRKVADLACLEIDESELEIFQKNFDQILQYFGKIESLNTDSVEPMVTPHQIDPELRADEVKPDITVEELLENAPEVKDSLFKVPPVV